MVRQLADEPDGVREAEAVAAPDVHLAGEGVERGEQAVLDEDVVARQGPQHARLAGVGVADERGGREVAAPLALVGAMVGDFLEPALETRDLAADRTAVRLELRLARPPQTDAAPDARQVGPHAREPRQQVLELRQLDLHLRLGRAGARREDVEDHLGAVHHPHAERLLEILSLHRGERLVEQHQGGTRVPYHALELLHLPLAKIEVRCGGFDPLVGPADDLGARRVGEPVELVQVLVHPTRVLGPLARGADEKGALDGWLDVDQLADAAKPLAQDPGVKVMGPVNRGGAAPVGCGAVAPRPAPGRAAA